MRIFLYSFFFFVCFATIALGQNYHPLVPVSEYYYQCTGKMGPGSDYGEQYQSKKGYIGPYQFGLISAYEAGLCSTPVPNMRNEQIWRFCDFNGPIAKKYNIHDQYDLRYNADAAKIQLEMMQNLTQKYDEYIYIHKYDLFYNKLVNGVILTPDVLRGLIHAKGRAAVDDFLHERDNRNNKNDSTYALATCLKQCMNNKGKTWFCR